jgi:hypothetical protein
MGFYGEPRDSTDIDIMTNFMLFGDHSDIAEILDNTKFEEFKTEHTDDGWFLVRKFRAGDWVIDLFEADSKLFRGMKSRAIPVKWKGKIVYIISKMDLIKLKRKRGSPQDLLDIQNLLKHR